MVEIQLEGGDGRNIAQFLPVVSHGNTQISGLARVTSRHQMRWADCKHARECSDVACVRRATKVHEGIRLVVIEIGLGAREFAFEGVCLWIADDAVKNAVRGVVCLAAGAHKGSEVAYTRPQVLCNLKDELCRQRKRPCLCAVSSHFEDIRGGAVEEGER